VRSRLTPPRRAAWFFETIDSQADDDGLAQRNG
jgi:hypothetical protein